MREANRFPKQRVAVRTATLGIYGLVKLPSIEGMGPAETKAFGQGDERMERKTNTNGTQPNEPATPTAMSKAVKETGTVSPRKGAQARRWLRLDAGWRFTRHLLEMVVAMMAGMAVLGVAIAALGEPPGYANLFARYGLMGASMAAPMVAWMRYRGHSWQDGGEMTAAMLVPMLAPVVPVELGVARYVPGLSEGSLMMLSHVAMIAGMVALMVYRWDRYAHGAHGHRP
jgi:hypothetical protein